MPHHTTAGFVSEYDIRQIASGLNINRHPDDQIIRCGLFTITAGDLRRLCTTAVIGARLIDASADFAFAYGFAPSAPDTAGQMTNENQDAPVQPHQSNQKETNHMQTITLSCDDITTLRGALEIAKDGFADMAREMRTIQTPGHGRLAEQFDRQAADATRLLDKIDH